MAELNKYVDSLIDFKNSLDDVSDHLMASEGNDSAIQNALVEIQDNSKNYDQGIQNIADEFVKAMKNKDGMTKLNFNDQIYHFAVALIRLINRIKKQQ